MLLSFSDIENGALATRNLLVLVNPFSGRKKAVAMYKEKVKPMFLEAEIKHTVRNTGNQAGSKPFFCLDHIF